MPKWLAIAAALALVILSALIIWAHEIARPSMQSRRAEAADQDEGA